MLSQSRLTRRTEESLPSWKVSTGFPLDSNESVALRACLAELFSRKSLSAAEKQTRRGGRDQKPLLICDDGKKRDVCWAVELDRGRGQMLDLRLWNHAVWTQCYKRCVIIKNCPLIISNVFIVTFGQRKYAERERNHWIKQLMRRHSVKLAQIITLHNNSVHQISVCWQNEKLTNEPQRVAQQSPALISV